ncbi:addiction module antidote protein, partial [uncultured Desulfovibrio sp.]|uniref:addiction module antidote protein n=1 Tax=uncultured Desulfovibrio sp. TaxID=167968 RepID=UPI00262585C2
MESVAGNVSINELPELDIAELLDNEEVMAAYLSDIMASGDSALIMSALGDIARAKGMSALARETGLSR